MLRFWFALLLLHIRQSVMYVYEHSQDNFGIAVKQLHTFPVFMFYTYTLKIKLSLPLAVVAQLYLGTFNEPLLTTSAFDSSLACCFNISILLSILITNRMDTSPPAINTNAILVKEHKTETVQIWPHFLLQQLHSKG